MPCWMLSQRRVLFVHLGKHGDIILMLPAFKAVADELGKPATCMVSREYAGVFEGTSYVQPWVVPYHWWRGVGEARKLAEQSGFEPVVVKWWDEPGALPPRALSPGRTTTLTIHGRTLEINAAEWDSYQSSQWRYAGFTMEQMLAWPLVFDRRNPGREAELRQRVFKTSLPKLLVNLPDSGASPFKLSHLVWSYVRNLGFELVDLSKVTARRIFDLLGLFDSAAGMVTSDTATLHLAAASKMPYVALINNGGAGSVPKGNCVLTVRYADVPQRRAQIVTALKGMK